MIDWIAEHSGMMGLLFFFLVFSLIALWAYSPRNKETLEDHKFIPLCGEGEETKS